MAGYSGTPLGKKLGIRPGARIVVLGEAPDLPLDPLPEGAAVLRGARRPVDVILYFTRSRSGLAKRFPTLAERLEPTGGLWIAWPKKTARISTDLSFETVQRIGLDAGLVDNKVCAVDDTWSGLRFVYRLEDRPSRKSSKTFNTD